MIERIHNGAGPFRGKAALCLLLAFALLSITLFVCSPWHKHDRIARQVCELAHFERGSLNGPAGHIQLAPPVLSSLGAPVEIAFESPSFRPAPILRPRAPPALAL